MADKKIPKKKILIIDDEQSILNLATAYFRNEGYEYLTAMDGPSGLKVARAYNPDLIVLDIMLPGMDGIELLSQLRRESDVYVILLTAKTEEIDKLLGLSVGADDYLTKPFSPRELMARIKAAFRRLQSTPQHLDRKVYTTQHLRIDTSSRQVWLDEEPVHLTSTEFDLLTALVEHNGMVLSREQLLEKIWGHDYFGDVRVVDVHLGHVRKKLGEFHGITTVRGIGFRFENVGG